MAPSECPLAGQGKPALDIAIACAMAEIAAGKFALQPGPVGCGVQATLDFLCL
jgi:hypothetical protein